MAESIGRGDYELGADVSGVKSGVAQADAIQDYLDKLALAPRELARVQTALDREQERWASYQTAVAVARAASAPAGRIH